jgi:hypothetical protein
VVAGAVIGSIAFLILAIGTFWWWRQRAAAAVEPAPEEVKDMPAPADTVLNRPDPTEKIVVTPAPTSSSAPTESVVRMYGNSTSTINLDPAPQAPEARRDSSQSNPFGDGHSIQTTSTGSQSTNVIPIAFVPPPASVLPPRSSPSPQASSMMRNPRVPGVELNMDHMNLSVDSVPLNSSVPSGVMADDRSYITNASYASDVLSEVPTIVTGRQVASAAKAAVVSASATKTSRPSVRSPLTASSFGPHDVLHEAEESQALPIHLNPFADQRSAGIRSSVATQGSSQPAHDVDTTAHQHPWNAGTDVSDSDRPLSSITQAASVIGANIMDATRVHLGFSQSASASVIPATPSTGGSRTLVRMASGRLVSPFTPNATGPLERQQESAMVNVQTRGQPSEKVLANPQRMSMSTMASGVSGRADSILESFTFVPPSPISNRPLRTPPRSPLAQETHQVPSRSTPVEDEVLEPPNRRVLGMSTGSQLSSMSTGLGSFPFQIDHGSEDNQSEEPPIGVLPNGQSLDKSKQRASLDTLALTKDLTSYPLGFDRQSKESFAVFMTSKG